MEAKQPDLKKQREHFIRTLYETLAGVISPTPYLQITEGKDIDVKFLDGQGRLPSPNSTEVTILDMDIASMFFDDFHLLFEGKTGVGKTYTSDGLFGTVFGPDGHYTIRLSVGVMGSSALEPFTTTMMENGMPKTHIDHAKCAQYGGLFIDEINRGESQEVFQVVDGKIHINGDTGYLGIPIPGTNRKKSLAIIAAMNPADADHSQALELDIAGENRFLKFRFPNGVAEAASSQLEKKVAEGLHDKFWTTLVKRAGLKGGWRENYPVIADPQQFAHALDGETREFLDASLSYVGHDPRETIARNNELMEQGGVASVLAVGNDNEYKVIREAQGTLKHGFVRRDLQKISDLAKLLGFIKGIKSGSYDAHISLNDMAASIGIVLESKTITGSDYGGLMKLVNDARKSYSDMHRQMKIPAGYGVRQAVWQAAVHAGTEGGFDAYLNTLHQGIAGMNVQASGHAQATLRSRLVADLVVLDHFSKAHEADVKAVLAEKGDNAFAAFEQLYDAKKAASSVYEHRLGSVLR